MQDQSEIFNVMKALRGVHRVMDGHGFDRTIQHLVWLRASQINRCGYCVEMHTREARQDGETSARLDRVIVWDQFDDFNERERAALAWTEALTELDRRVDFGPLRDRLRQHFTDEEIGVLTVAIGMINLWNRINVASH